MNVTKRKIEDLKPAEYNPRKITQMELDALKASIKEFGYVEPIIYNKTTDRIIGGHQRLKALKELGYKEVDTIEVEMTEIKEKALNIALNKIRGAWDEKKLIELLTSIEQENEDMLAKTGFQDKEIDYLLELEKLDKEPIFASGPEDDVEITKEYQVKEGEMVIIDGKHKIICGDSQDPKILRKLFGETKIDLIVTSPPYNKEKNNKELDEYLQTIENTFTEAKAFLNKGRYLCVNINREYGPINIPAKHDRIFERIGYQFFRNIYWTKPPGAARKTQTFKNPFPRYYMPKIQTETIQIYAFNEEPKTYHELITYKFGEEQKREKKEAIPSILLGRYIGNVWEMAAEPIRSYQPTTHFPIQLPFNCIRFFTFQGEKVFEPFLGSGTTIIAADQLNRTAYGIDIDPKYIDLTIARYKEYKPDAKIEVIK